MTQQSSSFGMVVLFFGAFFGLAGYPLFLLHRQRIGILFGTFIGLGAAVTFKDRLTSEQELFVMGATAFATAVLFYTSIMMMNIVMGVMLGFAVTHQIYAIVVHQLPSPAIPIIGGIICAVCAVGIGLYFMIGLLAFTGALMMLVGIQALALPKLMFDSPITIVGFNLTPVQNVIFILILIALTAAGVMTQLYGMRMLLQRR